MARASSGRTKDGGSDPSPRVGTSKPEPPASPGFAEAAEIPEWAPTRELARGLFLVATPIGNLGDITLRALWVLRSVERILCEDTRVTAKLLARYGIVKPLDSYHDYNADRVRPGIVEALRRGERLALVSDAGTPLVSDPGFKLVRAAIAENIPVTTTPGPSAATAAVILSGLPPEPFLFAGFLPPRSAARRRALAEWANLDATLIFFEGASRLPAALVDMHDVLGDRDAAIARELTKLHEEMRRGPLSALARYYRDAGAPRGETVIVVAPPLATTPDAADVDDRLRQALAGASLRDAVIRVAAETGLARRELYRRALALREPCER